MTANEVTVITAASAAPVQPPSATLIFNPGAGGSGHSSPEGLTEALHGIGYRPVYRATDSEDALQGALAGATGTVFVAGGDGTIRAAALRLAGRPNVTLGVIPMGTANNIARTLGVCGEPQDVIAAYADARAVPFDVGRVRAPWGEDTFLEALGCGAFADVLADYDPESGKSPLRAVGAIGSALSGLNPLPLTLSLDGAAQPELAHLLLEVMNTPATGPRLPLCSGADPCDGWLDVVSVNAEERDGLLAYAAALARDGFGELPSVQRARARSIDIPYLGQAFHVDGEVRPARPDLTGTVHVEIEAAALRVLRPNGRD
ncbi:diacylglycerol/lipid kinase family protein [Deinococcus aerophilus]|uniref:Diacylglycerol kinase n=1 Tax=Deinococcus aerophilus TaxID=522488 RepID=A0ABQ2GZS7_9DEIO|nr:diacylglycerol kinase family protein [Deinococcus aerophilus]GGM21554.1 diacylglycerol kinase [Deinococcus aerophilus]